jgi:hypothetical protein
MEELHFALKGDRVSLMLGDMEIATLNPEELHQLIAHLIACSLRLSGQPGRGVEPPQSLLPATEALVYESARRRAIVVSRIFADRRPVPVESSGPAGEELIGLAIGLVANPRLGDEIVAACQSLIEIEQTLKRETNS